MEITEGDLAIHNLMMTKESLEKQLADIELQITEIQNKAIQNIKEGKRLLAKTSLRRKHLLEKNHGKYFVYT